MFDIATMGLLRRAYNATPKLFFRKRFKLLKSGNTITKKEESKMLKRSIDVTPQVEMLREAAAIQARIVEVERIFPGKVRRSLDDDCVRLNLIRTLLVNRLGYMSHAQFNAAVAMGAEEIAQQTKIEEEAI